MKTTKIVTKFKMTEKEELHAQRVYEEIYKRRVAENKAITKNGIKSLAVILCCSLIIYISRLLK